MRLDTQRPPTKQSRLITRNYTRGYFAGSHASWANVVGKVSPARSAAAPTDVFASETTVTASDGTNAARLGPLGYVALPQTAWTTGQKITVGTFDFNWSGAAWAAGAHA